jgi:hypothetical protein
VGGDLEAADSACDGLEVVDSPRDELEAEREALVVGGGLAAPDGLVGTGSAPEDLEAAEAAGGLAK